jgi:hypothetical protein
MTTPAKHGDKMAATRHAPALNVTRKRGPVRGLFTVTRDGQALAMVRGWTDGRITRFDTFTGSHRNLRAAVSSLRGQL